MKTHRRCLVIAASALLAMPSAAFSQVRKEYRLGVLSIDDNPRDPI
ncbi:hypothetical protein [Variovorax sp. J22R115]|nr:hypothetical protein [Variovorax sp. J22R115]MDM0047735.1 hypothetical protein [Variovorax sp. J22R115]